LTDIVFQGATVYTPEGPRDVSVRVSDGVITEVGDVPARGARVVNTNGLYLLPGGVDVHVHSRDPGFPDKEDFGTLTAAAAAGGVTTVVDMPNTVPAVDSAGVLEAKAALARSKAHVDFGLWALIRSSSTPDQLRALAAAGATGFKAYLGYTFSISRKQVMHGFDAHDPDLEAPPDYGTLARLGPELHAIGLPVVIHAEDASVLKTFQRPLETYADVLASRPPEAESVAISAVAAVARQFDFHLHVAHLSSARGLAAAEEALASGTRITAETCPHYLWLTDADFPRLGAAMKINPPVKLASDRAALRDGLRRGVITIVATDHAPHTDEEKARGLAEAPPGSPGVQSLYLSCLQLAHEMGDVWLAARWVSENPAALAGLAGSKGRITPGHDADLVLVDPRRSTVVAARSMRSRQRHGALDGLRSSFAIKAVYGRGVPAARASGRLVPPATPVPAPS
jgi:dihydroorotase